MPSGLDGDLAGSGADLDVVRYGWLAPDESVSGLEDEYILSAGIPRPLLDRAGSESRDPIPGGPSPLSPFTCRF